MKLHQAMRVAGLLAWGLMAGSVAGDPAPAPPENPDLQGRGIQRAMALLAGSTAEKPNRVKVLFYGQSITAGADWTRWVIEDLQKRFPHARIESHNPAISGFASQLLVRTTDYDVMPFYPDLVIFHVYGSHTDYEEIIRRIRTRTTADVLMQSDHVTTWPQLKATGNFWTEQKEWGDKMNYFLLPAIAEKYGCAFHPQRWEWARYLQDNNLEPQALLSDQVHLNGRGQKLMAQLVSRYLVHRPDLPTDAWKDRVKTLEVGRDLKWENGVLRLEFEGNRIEAIAGPGAAGEAEVKIDGRSPAEFGSCYTVSRPSQAHGGWFPAIKKISWNTTPALETWTAKLSGFSDDQKDFAFQITGSVTGPDGSGRASEKFVSQSGRVVIEPQDWSFDYAWNVSKQRAPDGFEVSWTVLPLFTETLAIQPDSDPAPRPLVLASDLPPGRHVLELRVRGGKTPPLRALRVYNPPVR